MCQPDTHGVKLCPFTCHGEPIPNLNSFLKESQTEPLRKQMVASNSIMRRGFRAPDREQCFLEKAKRSMCYGEQRRLLQNLGGVFPITRVPKEILIVLMVPSSSSSSSI